MAAAEVGQVDCIRILVMEMGCKKDAQNKVHNYYVSASSSCMYSICRGGVHVCSPWLPFDGHCMGAGIPIGEPCYELEICKGYYV